MFKYLPKNPDSLFSILYAGVRLYMASFFYSMPLAVGVGLLTLLVRYLFKLNDVNLILLSIYSSFVTMIFIVPLIRRLDYVGRGFPFVIGEAFRGFWNGYLRMVSLTCVYTFVSLMTNIFVMTSKEMWYAYAITLLTMVVVNGYIVTHIYFANLYIILDRDPMVLAMQKSSAVSVKQMWNIAGVVSVFIFAYLILVEFIAPYAPYFRSEHLTFNYINFIAVVIGTPLFCCFQLVQFHQMKYNQQHNLP